MGKFLPVATRGRSSSRNSCATATTATAATTARKVSLKVFAVREDKFFPWRQEVEAVAETHAKASIATRVRSSSKHSCKSYFSTVSEGTFKTFSVLFGTRFVLQCHAVLLFGRVGFSHGDKR